MMRVTMLNSTCRVWVNLLRLAPRDKKIAGRMSAPRIWLNLANCKRMFKLRLSPCS